MGNNNKKVRIWDMMIPNTCWFYKLKALSSITTSSKSARVNNPTTKGPAKHQHHQPPSTPSSFLSSSSSFSSSKKTQQQQQQPPLLHQRKSYYFTRDLINTGCTPTTSNIAAAAHHHASKQTSSSSSSSSKTNRNSPESKSNQSQLLESSYSRTCVFTGCSSRASSAIESHVCTKLPPPTDDQYCSTTPDRLLSSLHTSSSSHEPNVESGGTSSASCSCKVDSLEENNHPPQETPPPVRSVREFQLPPIKTKTIVVDHTTMTSPPGGATSRRLSSVTNFGGGCVSVGLKLRTNSPRIIGNKKIDAEQGGRRRMRKSGGRRKRRSLSESFAVVKASKDPKRDFRESMVEMIVENNIQGSREMEDLLACYLSLNSDHYHELIIGVFKQIWFDLLLQDLK